VDGSSFTKTVSAQPLEVRIGDAERQAAARQLQQHFAEGRLTWEELDERLAVAYAARVNADLAGVFTDLPSLATPAAAMAPAPARLRWRPGIDVRFAIALGLILAAFAFLRLDNHDGSPFFVIVAFWLLFAARARRGWGPGHRHHHRPHQGHRHGHHNARG
jgi:hypothetical protein